MREKNIILTQLDRAANLDLSDSDAVKNFITQINDDYQLSIEIYDRDRNILYTTHSSQILNFMLDGDKKLPPLHEDYFTKNKEKLDNGKVIEIKSDQDEKNFLIGRKEISDGVIAEMRIRTSLIYDSANTAAAFIAIIAIIFIIPAFIWVVFFATKFSKPLTSMSRITRDMANLNFERRVETNSGGEIGELANSINEMADSLSDTLNKLQNEIELERNLDKMRKTFVANVSHELKTPLSIISGYAEGLKLNINAESRDKYCDTIIDESKRMNELVLSILTLSKYESGQANINFENINISKLANILSDRIFTGKDFTVNNKIPEDLNVFTDVLQAERVLQAYLENALCHTDKGGTIEIEAYEKDGFIRISVSNTGSHIKDDEIKEIWQSFYRGDASRKRDNDRFGLGLSIVSAIAQLQGTNCGAQNTDNGVTFWFDFKKTK